MDADRPGSLNLWTPRVIPRKGDFSCSEGESRDCRLPVMPVTIDPEPSEPEREAIVVAIAAGLVGDLGAWESAALAEGVDEELDP